jgi:hypothetical protein
MSSRIGTEAMLVCFKSGFSAAGLQAVNALILG